jgi:hypothetical protein
LYIYTDQSFADSRSYQGVKQRPEAHKTMHRHGTALTHHLHATRFWQQKDHLLLNSLRARVCPHYASGHTRAHIYHICHPPTSSVPHPHPQRPSQQPGRNRHGRNPPPLSRRPPAYIPRSHLFLQCAVAHCFHGPEDRDILRAAVFIYIPRKHLSWCHVCLRRDIDGRHLRAGS